MRVKRKRSKDESERVIVQRVKSGRVESVAVENKTVKRKRVDSIKTT